MTNPTNLFNASISLIPTPDSEPDPFPVAQRKFVRGSRNADGSYVWVLATAK